ncbi:MAG TPA: carboxylesterase family protein, partial [Micromonosporaceae bacterium]
LFVALSALEGAPVTAANYQAMISSTLGVPAAVAAAIAALYPLSAYPSPSEALGAVGTDAIFACPALTVDQSVSQFVPTFGYEFNDENAPELFLPPVGFPYGAAHASELQYLFNLTAAFPATLTPGQQQLAAAMRTYWSNFARAGFPSSPSVPLWSNFTTANQRLESFVPPTPQAETNFAAAHNCGFWSLGG